jgi:hypothetical protein
MTRTTIYQHFGKEQPEGTVPARDQIGGITI